MNLTLIDEFYHGANRHLHYYWNLRNLLGEGLSIVFGYPTAYAPAYPRRTP